jgi:ankyrin repeat protein
LAASQGHEDIVNFLVQEGADVNAEGKQNMKSHLST